MKTENPRKELLWFYDHLNAEGRETLLKIARAFVGTGTFSNNAEISADLKAHYEQMEKSLDKRMEEDF